MYAILESFGEDLEVEMLDDSDYVRNTDGSVMTFGTEEEATFHALSHCAGGFEVVAY
jgi:hypothetical protein